MHIKGIKIIIHPTFMGLLLICSICGFIARALIIFGLVILHETAHIIAARGYGVRVRSIELYPYGGTAVLEDTFEGKRKEETVIALAGPAFNFTLLLIIQYLRWEGIISGEWSLDLVKINFWLASFNLIPVLPLDGGRIARACFSGAFGFVRTTKFLAAAGKWLGGLFLILGFIMQAFGLYNYEPGLFIVLGIFFWLGSGKELENARLVFLKQLCRKKEHLLNKGLMPSTCLTVSKDTFLNKIIDQFSADRYCLVSVLGEKDRIERTLSETEVVQGMLERGINHRIKNIMK